MIPLNEIRKSNEFDNTIKLYDRHISELTKIYLPAVKYSRRKLYDSMYENKTIIFYDYPLKPLPEKHNYKLDSLIEMLKSGLPKGEKIYIRTGASRSLKKVSIGETIERWLRGISKFGVTDLHFRNTRFYRKIDAQAISYFNLLPECSEEASFLEMLTLVISAKGIFSDSHSDDGDGSNHCFVGKKLWFAWDREEGKIAGLQDCTHDPVYDQAKFNLDKFTTLKTAHWFVISENQTLFMPGNFTHKVITLEPYIGFGSFYVTFPNYFNSIKRWLLYSTVDVNTELLIALNKQCIKQINQITTNPEMGEQLGYEYFQRARRTWKRGLTAEQIKFLLNNDIFSEFLKHAFKV